MSLDFSGFDKAVVAQSIIIKVSGQHPLIKLANKLPWEAIIELIEGDLQKTEKRKWWLGRRLSVRIQIGAYLLQQMQNLTDRATEQLIQDNGRCREIDLLLN